MDSSIIGKIDKAMRYVEEKDRVTITALKAAFQGNHNIYNIYEIAYDADSWSCRCNFFSTRGLCSHTMALQRILDEMVAQDFGSQDNGHLEAL